MISKVKHRIRGKLKYQFAMLVFIRLLVPVLLVFVVIFIYAANQLKISNQQVNARQAEQMSEANAQLGTQLKHMTAVFSEYEQLRQILADKYEGGSTWKLANANMALRIIIGLNPYEGSRTLGAAYTAQGDLFNFYRGPGSYVTVKDFTEQQSEILLSLNIDNPDKIARLVWYPLTDNYLADEMTGNVREDKLVVASQRVFDRRVGTYLYTFVYALTEQDFYELNSPFLRDEKQQYLLLDENAAVLSASDIAYLQDTPVPEELTRQLEAGATEFSIGRGFSTLLVNSVRDAETGWYTVVLAPAVSVYRPLLQMYLLMTGVFVLFIVLYIWGSRKFLADIARPLEDLTEVMQQVQHGQFAQVPQPAAHNEIGTICHYYNKMVAQLEHLILDEYEKERQANRLQMKVLMGEMNPHFVYNTLSTVVWRANKAGQHELAEIAGKLGQLLRSSIKEGAVMTTVRQELEIAQQYIDIQRFRFKERLVVSLSISDASVLDLFTLRFVLQPCIENAIVHAMRQEPKVLHVQVDISAENNKLCIRIKDDGNGMDEEALHSLRAYLAHTAGENEDKKQGVGVKNIHDRLVLYFGAGYGLQVTSKENVGTEVTLSMPMLMTDPKSV